MRIFLTGIWVLFVLTPTLGQQFENIKAQINNDLVTVYYDLVSPDMQGLFHVDIYGSHDQYAIPLRMVSGDVGGNITPGRGKSISWQVATELQNYDGLINFELRGKDVRKSSSPIPVQLKLIAPNSSSRFKVENTYNISWTGGGNTDHVNLQLHKKNKKIHDIASRWTNSGTLDFTIPAQMGTSSKYWISITDSTDPLISDKTSFFKIKNSKKDFYNITLLTITIASLIVLQSSN